MIVASVASPPQGFLRGGPASRWHMETAGMRAFRSAKCAFSHAVPQGPGCRERSRGLAGLGGYGGVQRGAASRLALERRNGPQGLDDIREVGEHIIHLLPRGIAGQGKADGTMGIVEGHAHGAEHMRGLKAA